MEIISHDKLKEEKRSPQELGAAAMRVVGTRDKPYDLDWREAALCTKGDPETFFPGKGMSAKEAKKQCGQCKVRDECLEDALTTTSGDDHGVWGGTTERERRKIRRDRKLQQQSERAA